MSIRGNSSWPINTKEFNNLDEFLTHLPTTESLDTPCIMASQFDFELLQLQNAEIETTPPSTNTTSTNPPTTNNQYDEERRLMPPPKTIPRPLPRIPQPLPGQAKVVVHRAIFQQGGKRCPLFTITSKNRSEIKRLLDEFVRTYTSSRTSRRRRVYIRVRRISRIQNTLY